MRAEQFEETLLQFIRRWPFEPFVVELLDGQRIDVFSPKVVVGGGAASFITPAFDLVDFACEEVGAILPWYNRTATSDGGRALMSVAEFEQTLLRFKYHEPFEPFVVELLDGRVIEIGEPAVLFDENGATYVTPEFDFVGFRRENVRAIRPAAQGVAS
jgi:hypothetical protein